MPRQKKFIFPTSHKRACVLAGIPLFGTMLFYVLLQLTSVRVGVLALALCPILMLAIYRAETQQIPSRRALACFLSVSFAVAVISVFALMGYELWGIYTYELGAGAGANGQSFLHFATQSLLASAVWSDYLDEYAWAFAASIIGAVLAYLWVARSSLPNQNSS